MVWEIGRSLADYISNDLIISGRNRSVSATAVVDCFCDDIVSLSLRGYFLKSVETRYVLSLGSAPFMVNIAAAASDFALKCCGRRTMALRGSSFFVVDFFGSTVRVFCCFN